MCSREINCYSIRWARNNRKKPDLYGISLNPYSGKRLVRKMKGGDYNYQLIQSKLDFQNLLLFLFYFSYRERLEYSFHGGKKKSSSQMFKKRNLFISIGLVFSLPIIR